MNETNFLYWLRYFQTIDLIVVHSFLIKLQNSIPTMKSRNKFLKRKIEKIDRITTVPYRFITNLPANRSPLKTDQSNNLADSDGGTEPEKKEVIQFVGINPFLACFGDADSTILPDGVAGLLISDLAGETGTSESKSNAMSIPSSFSKRSNLLDPLIKLPLFTVC